MEKTHTGVLYSNARSLKLYLKEISTQVSFCEYCEILRTAIFIEHLWFTANTTEYWHHKLYDATFWENS